MDNATVPIT